MEVWQKLKELILWRNNSVGKMVDYYYEKERLKNLVDKILSTKYGWLPQKEHDDFYSIAGTTVWYCEKHYDPKKNKNFHRYLVDSLHRKFKTQLTKINRKKRGGGVVNDSLDRYVDENGDVTLGEILSAKETPDLDILAQRYLDSLTKKQRQIAELMMQGCTDRDIKTMLGMSNEQFGVIVMNMKKSEKIAPLKTLKERME